MEPIFFSRKDQNFEKSYYFSRNLRQIFFKLFKKTGSFLKPEQICRCGVNKIGKPQVKKNVRNGPFKRNILL